MVSISEAQGLMANQNPNIVSDTYSGRAVDKGAGTLNPPPAPAVPAVPNNMAQASSAATNLSNQLYQGGPIQGLESQRDAQLMELYNYDSQLGQIYAGGNIFPSVEGYVDNPADRIASLANISGQTANTAARTSSAIDVTERAYNTAISNVLDKFLNFAQLQQQQSQFDKEYELKRQELALKSGGNDKSARAMAALFGSNPANALQGYEVVPDNFQGPITANMIKFSDAQKMIKSPSGRPTYNSFLAAMNEDPDNATKYYDLYQKANSAFSPEMTSQQQTLALQTGTLEANLKTLQDSWQQIPFWQKGFGRQQIGSTLSTSGVAPNVTGYNSLYSGLVAPVARILSGESGPLNESDIARAKNLLPSLGDSEANAQKKFQNLAILLQNSKSKLAEVSGTGVPTSGSSTVIGALQPQTYPTLPTTLAPEATPTLAAPQMGGMPTEPTIKVMELTSGDVGDIPQSEFDPMRYVKVRY
jgi:hypothetical protein